MRKHFYAVLAMALVAGLAGCDPLGQEQPIAPTTDSRLTSSAGPAVVNVTAEHLDFELSRNQMASGWTTFLFKNHSQHAHFFLIEKLPLFDRDGDGVAEQMRLADYITDLAKPFQNLMDDMIGRAPSFPGSEFGAWGVEYLGGSGITGAGETSQVTVWLDPGLYVIECYVKSSDGTFHAIGGMTEELRVGARANHAGPPPRPSLRLTLSIEHGIEVEGSIDRPGTHTVEVYFESQQYYANFVQHDVNLVRIDGDTNLERVAAWMDWRLVPSTPYYNDFGGMTTPAPATFLGGAQEQPAGTTAYFTVHLEKGDYAWIGELPADVLLAPSGPDWIVPFTVQ